MLIFVAKIQIQNIFSKNFCICTNVLLGLSLCGFGRIVIQRKRKPHILYIISVFRGCENDLRTKT